MRNHGLVAMALLACADQGVMAEDLPRQAVLPLSLAQKAATAAVAACEAAGYRVSAAVVDRAGVLKALARADGAGPHTVDSSRRKAYTAASLGEATSTLAELVAGRSELRALGDMNESVLILGGGLPLRFKGELVGGIGVGGAPGAGLDESCAGAGLKAADADGAKKQP